MFYKLTKSTGKAQCVILYSVFSFMAAKKKPLPLLILLGLHIMEVFQKGLPLAEEKGINKAEAVLNTLCFGFTWWLPIKKGD